MGAAIPRPTIKMNTGPLRILIVDDHEMMRQALRSYLQARPGWQVIAEAVDGRDAVAKALQLRPDVIVMDVTMPNLNGFDAARIIHQQDPKLEIVIVSQHEVGGLAERALEAGARGYIAKSQITKDLVPAVEAASKHQPIKSSALPTDGGAKA